MSEPVFRENVRFVIIRRFGYLPEAKIYESCLLNAGIQGFLSNTNTSQLLPFMDGAIALHVPENQLDEAREIIGELDAEALKPPYDADYRDADLDDIEFARLVAERERRLNAQPGRITLLLILALTGIAALVYAILMGYRYF